MLLYNLLCTYRIPLSDTGKSTVKKKPEGHPLIIKLLLSLWLLYKNYINYYHLFKLSFYIKRREHIIYNIYNTVISLYTHFQANHKSGGTNLVGVHRFPPPFLQSINSNMTLIIYSSPGIELLSLYCLCMLCLMIFPIHFPRIQDDWKKPELKLPVEYVKKSRILIKLLQKEKAEALAGIEHYKWVMWITI